MIVAFLKSTDRLFTSPKLALFFSINGLFQKKELYTPVEDIDFFEVDPPWISSQIYCNPPGIFLFFALNQPTTFTLPPGIFLLISSTGGGVTIYFWKSHIWENCEKDLHWRFAKFCHWRQIKWAWSIVQLTTTTTWEGNTFSCCLYKPPWWWWTQKIKV